MSYTTMPIVGAFYRPPAKLVCSVLPVGQQLLLYAEPDNSFDPNAVAVWLMTETLGDAAKAALAEALPASGLTLEQFLDQTEWHLGYIPKDLAAQLKSAQVVVNDREFAVTFTTSTKGAPAVRFDGPVL